MNDTTNKITPKHLYLATGVIVAAMVAIFVVKPMLDADDAYSSDERAAYAWCKKYDRDFNKSSASDRNSCVRIYTKLNSTK